MALSQRETDSFPASLVPFLTTLLFVVLSVVPLHIPGFATVAPTFALMAVYHWTIYRPELLPPVAVFGLGLLLDFMNATPYVGISALSLLLAQQALLAVRRVFVNRLFPLLWAGFLMTAAAMIVFQWGLVSLLKGGALGTQPFLFEAALAIPAFPVASYFLTRVQRTLLMRS
jgi:rod shape-determining protein MreD